MYYFLYSLFALLYFVWIIYKSKSKYYTGLVSFLILSFPILNRDEFTIHVPFGFDLYPTRIFFLIGIVSLFFYYTTNISNSKILHQPLKSFEYILLAYICVSSVVIIINAPGFRELVPLISGQLVFAVMYLISRNNIHLEDKNRIINLLIIFGSLSSLVSIIQFLFAPEFFRISSERIAFGKFTRANGFFFDEFDNGLFLTSLTILVVFQKRNFTQKFFFITLFSLGVAFTMHRGSWVILLLVLTTSSVLYFTNTTQKNQKISLLFGFFMIICVLIGLIVFPRRALATGSVKDFINNQLLRETISIRTSLQNLGIKIIAQYPEGIGDFSYPTYRKLYSRSGLPYNLGRPLIVHNGFIAAGVKYGVLGGLLFSLFFLQSFITSYRLQKRSPKEYYAIMLILGIFFAINITQEMSFLGSFPQIIFAYYLSDLATV